MPAEVNLDFVYRTVGALFLENVALREALAKLQQEKSAVEVGKDEPEE